MTARILSYYEAIDEASSQMLDAARHGDWDQVLRIESACAILISQLKVEASTAVLTPDEAHLKSHIMERVLLNDAEVRMLVEPWLEDLDQVLSTESRTLH